VGVLRGTPGFSMVLALSSARVTATAADCLAASSAVRAGSLSCGATESLEQPANSASDASAVRARILCIFMSILPFARIGVLG